jgi:hypothetical protein
LHVLVHIIYHKNYLLWPPMGDLATIWKFDNRPVIGAVSGEIIRIHGLIVGVWLRGLRVRAAFWGGIRRRL